MPLVSKSQQGYMFKFHPEIAKRWAKITPNIKKLPEHKSKKSILKKYIGKGGPNHPEDILSQVPKLNFMSHKLDKNSPKGKGGPLGVSSFDQAATPINLLKTGPIPPTVKDR